MSLTLGAVFVLLVVAHRFLRHREAPGKPPTVPYLLPWIGSMISIGKDPDRFFRDAASKVGATGVFGVMVGGNLKYYVTDVKLIREVYKNAKSFAFSPIRLEFSMDFFGMSPESVYTPYTKDELFAYHHRLLAPTAIASLTSSFAQHTLRILSSHNPAKCTSLVQFLLPQMYDSSTLAFMGSTFPTTATYPLFLAFDNAIPLFAAGFMPKFVTSSARKIRSQLTDVIQQWIEERWNVEKGERDESACSLVQKMVDDSRAAGYDDRDVAAAILSDLWALQANSTWACFWVIALMLRQQSGLAPLYQELEASLETFKATNPQSSSFLSSFILSAQLPLLTSTVTETLRFTTSSASIRRVVEPEGASLAGYTFEKDDELVCVTRAAHQNAELYEDPLVFMPRRFLDEDKDKAGRFWSPFGGGVSMCEGRHFAQQEIRIFVACLLLFFDISLDPSSSKVELDMSRIGLGVLHPKGDLTVLVKKREIVF